MGECHCEVNCQPVNGGLTPLRLTDVCPVKQISRDTDARWLGLQAVPSAITSNVGKEELDRFSYWSRHRGTASNPGCPFVCFAEWIRDGSS